MFKKLHGYMIWIYVKDQIEPIDHEFFSDKAEAERACEKAFDEIDGVEMVTLDEVAYNGYSYEFEAA